MVYSLGSFCKLITIFGKEQRYVGVDPIQKRGSSKILSSFVQDASLLQQVIF